MKHLRVYQLAVKFHRSVQTLAIKGELRDQLHRASMSIVLNIAEACGKPTRKDRTRFLNIAMGSLRETQALLEILEDAALIKLSDHLGALLYKFTLNSGGS